jgi:hypothetical protein
MRGVKVQFFFINNNWQASQSFPVVSNFDDRLNDGVVSTIKKKITVDMSENQGYRQDNLYSDANNTNDPLMFYGVQMMNTASYPRDSD